ncbi:Uncharacterised protein [Staphylococcus microti]|uniref:Uncharacterized protein n=1 Tax=Staphylococcus microti TaxID=569857 RepID=A0A380GTA0_9STAP|nr:hypothetical protein [Staphylococcus microti]PNZ77542.1 hypothetical protein CD132_10495 [Staphylococcus microti]SUM56428.1 Uncharacterised protein [Staphylococcus microti]
MKKVFASLVVILLITILCVAGLFAYGSYQDIAQKKTDVQNLEKQVQDKKKQKQDNEKNKQSQETENENTNTVVQQPQQPIVNEPTPQEPEQVQPEEEKPFQGGDYGTD